MSHAHTVIQTLERVSHRLMLFGFLVQGFPALFSLNADLIALQLLQSRLVFLHTHNFTQLTSECLGFVLTDLDVYLHFGLMFHLYSLFLHASEVQRIFGVTCDHRLV